MAKSSWAGCYALDGDHAEKPIENAVKHSAAIISLFEERRDGDEGADPELENVEVLLTDQGMYFFKIYAQSHALDTSVVWALFLRMLVLNELVPAAVRSDNTAQTQPHNRTHQRNLIQHNATHTRETDTRLTPPYPVATDCAVGSPEPARLLADPAARGRGGGELAAHVPRRLLPGRQRHRVVL